LLIAPPPKDVPLCALEDVPVFHRACHTPNVLMPPAFPSPVMAATTAPTVAPTSLEPEPGGYVQLGCAQDDRNNRVRHGHAGRLNPREDDLKKKWRKRI